MELGPVHLLVVGFEDGRFEGKSLADAWVHPEDLVAIGAAGG